MLFEYLGKLSLKLVKQRVEATGGDGLGGFFCLALLFLDSTAVKTLKIDIAKKKALEFFQIPKNRHRPEVILSRIHFNFFCSRVGHNSRLDIGRNTESIFTSLVVYKFVKHELA